MFINYLLAGILDGSFTALCTTFVFLYENKSGLRKGAVMWASASKLPLPLVGIGQTFLSSNYKKMVACYISFLSLCKLQEQSKQAVVTKSSSVHGKV